MSAQPLPTGPTRATIVIAEDDAATRMLLCQVLRRERFRVIAVDNGRRACEAVRRERPDVVLLDWRMPVMDGRAALAELKSSKETRGIPIVMLTSQSQVDERIIALEAGVQDFLSKPFDPRELVACIEQQLRWQQGLATDANAAFLEERNALLAASERRYRLLAEAMPHMVWLASPGGDLTYVNVAWHNYTGTTTEQIGPDGWVSSLHPDDHVVSLRAWSESLATAQPYEAQVRFRRASDGMYRWHLVRAIPTCDAAGAIVEWVASCADIHDYKIASEPRAILDTMGSIVSIRTATGFVDYSSPYWSQYTGSRPDAGLGFGWRDFIHPDDIGGIEHARAQTGTLPENVHQYEIRILGHDGCYRWFLSRSTMLPRTAGTPPRWLDTATDVDDLKRVQSALEDSETRYRALTDSVPQLVWVIGADSELEYINHRWVEYTGLTLDRMRAVGLTEIVAAHDLQMLVTLSAPPVSAQFTCEARLRRHDGVYRWHVVHAVPFHYAAGNTNKWIGTATDIEDSKVAAAALATAAAELEHLAHHDPMTNLPNRMLLMERLTQAIALAQRGKTGVIVLFLDLDRFKTINDSHGHAAGDQVLAITGRRIEDALRAGDTASRVGGDEFVLVCSTTDAAEDAARLATRLIAAVGGPIDIDGDSVSVGASIGISLYPTDSLRGEELIERADSAMYAAKQSGRNAFRFYRADTQTSLLASLDFETELRQALTSDQLVVSYEPVLAPLTGRPIGAQARVNWQHPQRGLLASTQFIPFAEEHRLIGPIGSIVINAACAQLASLGAQVGADFSIAINISARQFIEPGFVDSIAAALAFHRVDPSKIEIEIAENVVMGKPLEVERILAELNALGVRLSIDSFGAGCRALAAIKDFPLFAIKLDRSFIHGLVADPADDALTKTIVTLAHSLGVRVVAEGVESVAHLAALRALGPNAFQGYLASRLLNASDLETFVTAGTEPLGLGRPTVKTDSRDTDCRLRGDTELPRL